MTAPSGVDNAAGFPWGRNSPTRAQRILAASLIAVAAALAHFFRSAEYGGLSDFATVWNGARLILERSNPYLLIGPGRQVSLPSPPYYPAPAFLSAMPLAWIPLHWASTVFVFLSAWLLAYGATRDGWHRLPIFPSIAFITSAQLAQWSIFFSASYFLPLLAFFALAKPQSSVPVLASERDKAAVLAAAAGGVLLTVASFVLLPHWVSDWFSLVRSTDEFRSPILSIPGALIALVLLRWRRPEAWLVFTAACLPQTWYPYNSLVLLLVAATYREACVLSLVSTAGWVAAALLSTGSTRSSEVRHADMIALIFACYLPAVVVVLRRKNTGPSPYWIARWLSAPP